MSTSSAESLPATDGNKKLRTLATIISLAELTSYSVTLAVKIYLGYFIYRTSWFLGAMIMALSIFSCLGLLILYARLLYGVLLMKKYGFIAWFLLSPICFIVIPFLCIFQL